MRHRITLALLASLGIVLLISCATVRPPEATFQGRTTFAPGFRPLKVSATTLADGDQRADVSSAYPPMPSGDRKVSDQDIRDRAAALADCGIAACYANDPALARRALDEAIATMGGHVATASDAKARALFFSKESDKTFRGEPHERAVTFLFRGMLYLAEGDAENAQACFKSGALQDAMASGTEDRSDWLSIDLLLLAAKRMLDSPDAADWQAFIAKEYSGGGLPDGWQTTAVRPVVILLAAGRGPVKQAEMLRNGELVYLDVPSKVRGFRVLGEKNTTLACASPTDDCFVQAATRGKREMDKVLAGKAQTRRGLKTTSGVLKDVGETMENLPGGLSVLGTALRIGAKASELAARGIHSEADTRKVELVPNEFYLVMADANRLGASATLQVLGQADEVLAEGVASIRAKPDGAQVILARFPY